MNITNTIVCNEQALKQLKRFSGKVYNRIFRRQLIFCNGFPLLGLPLAWMCRNNGLGFDVLMFFLSVILPLCFWNARAAYLRCIVDRKRRALQGVGEVTITMTDDDYACQGGGMQTRARWQALGSSYLFLGDGFAILEGQNPTAFVSSLSECGVDATELKEVLVRAGLKDYGLCCDRGWIRLVIFMLAGAVVGMLGSLTQNKGRGALPPEPACTLADDEDDEAREGEAFSLGDIDFDERWIDLDYQVSAVRSPTNRTEISYQDFANIIAVLREQKEPKELCLCFSFADVADPSHPLETLASLTNANLSISLTLSRCSNLTDVAILGRLPVEKLSLVGNSQLRQVRGLEQCPLRELIVVDCPVDSLDRICSHTGLKELYLTDCALNQPDKASLIARWPQLDILHFSQDSKDTVVALFSETERFAKSIAGADRVVVRKGGFGCCGDPDKAPVLCTLTDPSEIASFGELFTFKDLGMNDSCLCCGYPGIDWWKGDRIVARTSVQHLKGLRWKGFYGDAQFTPEAEKALSAWFDAHKIEVGR